LRHALGARERQIGDGARYAPVAIVERVDGDEPEMGNPGLEDRIGLRVLEPVKETPHLLIQPVGCRCFVVNPFMPEWP